MRRFSSPIALFPVAAVIAAATAIADVGTAASAPSLRDVLKRVGAYAVSYGESLASVVADEGYVQELVLRGEGTLDSEAPARLRDCVRQGLQCGRLAGVPQRAARRWHGRRRPRRTARTHLPRHAWIRAGAGQSDRRGKRPPQYRSGPTQLQRPDDGPAVHPAAASGALPFSQGRGRALRRRAGVGDRLPRTAPIRRSFARPKDGMRPRKDGSGLRRTTAA